MNRRTLLAFVVAPLVPPLLYWVFVSAPSLAALPYEVAYGAMWTYPVTLVVGVPAYRLITAFSRLSAAHVLSISGLAGSATLCLMSKRDIDARTVGLGGLLGLSAGVAFWLLWRAGAAQPRVAADRAAPGR